MRRIALVAGMLAIAFTMLFAINWLQAWSRRKYGNV